MKYSSQPIKKSVASFTENNDFFKFQDPVAISLDKDYCSFILTWTYSLSLSLSLSLCICKYMCI